MTKAPRAHAREEVGTEEVAKQKKLAAACHSSLAPDLGHAPCVRCLGRLSRLLPHVLDLRGRRLSGLALVTVMEASYSHVPAALWALYVVLQRASVGGHALRCRLVHLGHQRESHFPTGAPEKESHN